MKGMKITVLGPFWMRDEKGNVIMQGQMREIVFEECDGGETRLKVIEPKECPNCGAIIK